MKTRIQWARVVSVVLAVTLLSAAVVEAQEQGQGRDGGQRPQGRQRGGRGGFGFGGGGGFTFGGPGGGLDKATLLGLEQVQKELKIGEDQAFFVQELVASQREKSRSLFSSLGNFREMSNEERQKAFEEMRAKREKQTKEAEKEIEAFLSADQQKRLNEIALQVRGIRALDDPAIAKTLGITDAQKEQMQAAYEAQREAQRELFASLRGGAGGGRPGAGGQGGRGAGAPGGRGGFDFNAMREKMQELGKQTEQKVLAVLTPAQKEQFAAMKGKPFELDRAAMFRGFGGRGGPGGRGPGGAGGGRRPGGRPQRPASE